jgi:hypothetical protein
LKIQLRDNEERKKETLPVSRLSTCKTASALPDQDIRLDSTNMKGTRSSSTRREYIRTFRRVSCGLRVIEGTLLRFLLFLLELEKTTEEGYVVTFLWGIIVLKPRLDGLVLLVEESHIRHEVLDDIHCNIERGLSTFGGRNRTRKNKHTVRQWVDLCRLALVTVDSAETSECVLSVDVHGTRSADALAT